MVRIKNPKFERIIEREVKKEGVTGDYEVNVWLANEKEMRRLHRKWMAKQGYTEELHEVLSFPLERDASYPDGVTRLGDIVIGKGETEKIEELVRHGCRHLLGKHHA